MVDISQVTLALLAGGEGARMGQPKALLRVGDQPILKHLLGRWRWSGPTMLVTAPGREHPPGCEEFDREVVDPVAGAGPLRGIATALEASETEMVIVATCDMPLVGTEQLRWLGRAIAGNANATGVLLRRGDAIEPFPCAMCKSAHGVLAERLDREVRSVHSLSSLPMFCTLPSPREWPDDVWTNLNEPADLEQFLKSQRV